MGAGFLIAKGGAGSRHSKGKDMEQKIQPGVVNGASELLGEVFGGAGAHARSAVGVAELPLGAPVEVELVVEVSLNSGATS